MSQPDSEVSDATQRVYVDKVSPASAVRRPSAGTGSRPTAQQRSAALANKKKKERMTLITLSIIAAVLLLVVLAIILVFILRKPADDGKIASNVYAAGVNLGGMTEEQAKQALKEATGNTYTQYDMTVQVLDTTILLSPADTGAQLDVDAVVEAALEYSRSSSKADLKKSYTVSILPYLNLNTDYIQSVVSDLGSQYSTLKTETTYTLSGTKPDLDQEDPDTSIVYQTLTIHVGTAYYDLNTTKLYEQIMDAYNINLFQVTGECSVDAPNEFDCDSLYSLLCRDYINAEFDTITYEITPEVYGYGFSLDELKTAMSSAQYGSTFTLELRFIEPDITAEFYTSEMFQDTLASYASQLSSDANWNANMELACQALNGYIIRAGEEFSFNEVLGELTVNKGYTAVGIYVGKTYQQVVGGGVCQVATALYNCALKADLDILERHSHSYVPTFASAGFDAEIIYGSADLRFRNNTEHPIRIDISEGNNNLVFSLAGTDSRDYTVEITYKITKTKTPGTVYNTMTSDNPGGYKEGDVLCEPITGCNVTVTRTTYSKENGRQLDSSVISESVYAKRDKVVVRFEEEPEIPVDPDTPDPPTDPSVPDDTDPTESTNTTNSTDPDDEEIA